MSLLNIVLLLTTIVLIVILIKKSKGHTLDFHIEPYSERYEQTIDSFISQLADKDLKKVKKQERKDEKKKKQHLFVVPFQGDTKASASKTLAQIVQVLVEVVQKEDIVVCQIQSPGGMVPHYGHAAQILARLRDKCHLVASVDLVAASGGYMMACVCPHIIASPLSIVGSIGVVAQMPNFHRFLKGRDIDFEEHTAGDSKRSLTVFGENTPEKRERFTEKLEVTHQLFKEHIAKYRPEVDLDKVSHGDYFYACEAKNIEDNHLVDRIISLDDYIQEHQNSHRIWRIALEEKESLIKKIFVTLKNSVQGILSYVL